MLARHHVGKPDNGVERRADLVADPGQEFRLVSICRLGGALGVAKFLFGPLPLGDVADDGAVTVGGGAGRWS